MQSLATPGFKMQWVSVDATFSPDGQLAYVRGSNEVTLPGADGKLTTEYGRGITIWRRDRHSDWRCVVDIWNAPPAEQAQPAPATGAPR